MVYKAIFLAPLMVALAAGPALAKPTVIAELGTAPLLGESTSTAQMQARVAHNEGVVSAAATRLGLSSGEYAQFREAVATSRVAWVTVPRHLDAMTWQGGGRVYVLHDVIIPAKTHGWEVDLPQRNGHVLALYMPAACGNLSLVRRAAPVIAAHAPLRRVAALKVAPVAAPIAAVAAVPPPAAVPNDAPAAAPVQVAQAEFPPAAAGAHHAAFFLAPLLFGLAALAGGGGGQSAPAVVPAAKCP